MSMHFLVVCSILIGLFGQLVAVPMQSVVAKTAPVQSTVSKKLKANYDAQMNNPLYQKGFAIISDQKLSKEYDATLSSINHFFVGYTATIVKSLSSTTEKKAVVPMATVLKVISTQSTSFMPGAISAVAHFAKTTPSHTLNQQQHTVENKVKAVLQQIPPKQDQTKQQKRAQGLQTLLNVVSRKS